MSPSNDQNNEEDFLFIVRIQNTDLDGSKPVHMALTQIKGIGTRVAEAIARKGGFDRSTPIGKLSEERRAELTEIVDNVYKHIPPWLKNRRFDYDTGEDLHVLSQDVDTYLREDLNRMKKTRSYKGVRHEANLKVRGQRLASNGRKGAAMGVSRKK